VDTAGSSAGYDAQPVTTTPEDWTQHSLVQVEGGFIAGLALGRVPFGSVVAGAISGPGSRWAEIGRGVGEIVGGGFAFAAGMAGMKFSSMLAKNTARLERINEITEFQALGPEASSWRSSASRVCQVKSDTGRARVSVASVVSVSCGPCRSLMMLR